MLLYVLRVCNMCVHACVILYVCVCLCVCVHVCLTVHVLNKKGQFPSRFCFFFFLARSYTDTTIQTPNAQGIPKHISDSHRSRSIMT